jgi:hypothetical protein
MIILIITSIIGPNHKPFWAKAQGNQFQLGGSHGHCLRRYALLGCSLLVAGQGKAGQGF